MADPLTWTDPATLVGGGGALALVVSAAKAIFDWRHKHAQQHTTAEDLARDDLQATTREQRIELSQMRTELATARSEMRAQEEQHRIGLRACEERSERFLDEMRKLHSENDALRSRYHRLSNYIAQVRAEVDIDRLERGLKSLPLPSWVDETIIGPTSKEKPS